MASGSQFLLLLWKNWLIQKRKPVATTLEILLPVFFSFILIIIRQFVDDDVYSEPTTWNSFQVDDFRDDFIPYTVAAGSPYPFKWQLAYSPKNPTTDTIMLEVANRLDLCIPCFNWLAFSNEEEMLAFIGKQNITTVDLLGGIVFNEGDFNSDGSLAEKITYTVRMKAEQYFGRGSSLRIYSASDWYTSFLFPLYPPLGPRQVNETDGGVPGYYREGFLSIQRALDMAIIHQHANTSQPEAIPVSIQRYPYPPYIYDPYVLVLANDLPGIILLSFLVAAPNIVKDLVLEKERRLRETMKMMGLKLSLSWVSWFVKYFMFLLISVFIMTFLFCIDFGNGAIINHSDPTVIFMFLMLYAIATIMFCFMISAFFSKANSGAAAGGILFIVAAIPYSIIKLPGRYENMTVGDKVLASLVSNTAMPLGCLQLAGYEVSGVGLQWSNLNTPLNVDDKFTMAHTFIMFVIDSIMYGIVTWYIDSVMPREYGIRLPLYFPFTKSYWCGSSPSSVDDVSDDIDYKGKESLFEENPPNVNMGIKIRKLRKEFKKDGVMQAVVDDVSLDVFEGQITALLGHNGAGKTTTISMITGFIPPTSGTAYVNNHDIRTDINGVRESLGLCPQHDVLFDTLTVEEHLKFFAKLKGYPSAEVPNEVNQMIQLLKLKDKRNAQSRMLSGGMKRKLCVGIALIGKSRTVILDEPTSGMDPEARRATWDILQSQRSGRTMILTTHFMEEADFLGDRIAIMANGVVQCCGSSLFLKNKYGVGYHMVMVKSPDCITDQVTKVVKSYVPDASLESNISAELSYVLPSEHSDKFEGLFGNLEKNKDSLGILSFGASVTTLEEVFIKVGEEIDSTLADKLHHVDSDEGPVVHSNGVRPNEYEIIDGFRSSDDLIDGRKKNSRNNSLPAAFGVDFERNTGFKLYLEQFFAMLIKRMIHTGRNKLITIVQLVVPVAFALIACIVMVTLPGPRDPPAIDFGLYQLRDSESPYDISDQSNGSNTVIPQLAAKHRIFLEPNTTAYQVDNLEDYLATKGEEDWGFYRQSMMTATTFNGTADTTNILGWFNNEGFHSAPMEINVISNTLLKYFASDDHEIRTVNHPLPRATNNQLEEEINTSTAVAFLVSYYVYFGMCFVLSTFIVFLIKERSNRAKHIQFVSGVHMFNYWISTFAWDFINYMVPCFLLIIVFAAFGIEPYYKGASAGYFLLLYLGFGWACLPCMYLLSFAFNVPASGYVWSTVLNLFTGTVALLVVGIMNIPALGVEEAAEVLNVIFFVTLPNYAFGVSMQDLYMNYETREICGAITDNDLGNVCELLKIYNETNPCCPENCGENCVDITIDYVSWSEPGIGRGLTFMALQGLFFFSCIFFAESGFARRMWNKAVSGTHAGTQNNSDELNMDGNILLDSDVKAEKERINQMNIEESSDILILKELGKIYNGSFVAVDGLSVGVPMGECFGLLGVNGAGKTTTFKMLTGDETITSGEAFVENYSVARDIKEVQQKLGYCPQFDALIEQMTVKETLHMYARLRGVKEEYIFPIVDALIEQLLLSDHKDKQAGTLSGGNKRKLSTAIALVGEPPIVFLDEPTTGMDPVARRLLWDTLTKFRASGRTLVLTSHSMEECEALCTRIAIMVNGQFKCLGGTQHLKNKFGEGYTIMAKVKGGLDNEVENKTLALRTFIEGTFPGCVLKDLHHGYVHYQVNKANISWAQIFGIMERAKNQYEIEDYSVSQTTLEQVFLNFAKNQLPPKEVESSCTTKTNNCLRFCCCCGCCKNNATVPTKSNTLVVSANSEYAVPASSGTSTVPMPVTTYQGGRLSTDL